jgi:hypothetical protein
MAILQQPVNSSNPFAEVIGDDLAPAGTFVATVIDIRDEFGVQRQKFQSLEMETVDLTTFLFGFRDAQGYEHRASSRRMKISGNEKSTLFGFLKGVLGRAPQYGWDYMELRGKQCLLPVEHIQRRDGAGVFAGIAALSPVPAGMGEPGRQETGVRSQNSGGGQVSGGNGGAGGPRPTPPANRPVGAPQGARPAPAVRPSAPSPAPAVNDPIPF